MKIKERYAGGMSQQPLFVVYCESKLNQVTFVQWVRAADAAEAMKKVEQPGVVPREAQVMPEGEAQMLDAMNRMQLGIASANDRLRQIQGAHLILRPMRTIVIGVFIGLAVWTVGWLVLSLLISRR